jgi:hypothetical protein
MRKVLFHLWIWGGLAAFYFTAKLVVGAMSTEMVLGLWFGIVWTAGCFYGYERIDRWERARYGDES